MALSKKGKVYSIIFLLIILSLIGLLVYNNKAKGCVGEDLYNNETDICSFIVTIAKPDCVDGIITNGVCNYTSKSPFNNSLILSFLGLSILVGVVLLTIQIVRKKQLESEYGVEKEREALPFVKVFEKMQKNIAINNGIYVREDIEGKMRVAPNRIILEQHEQYQHPDSREYFKIIEYNIVDPYSDLSMKGSMSEQNGLKTAVVCLSRGEEIIDNYNYGMQRVAFDEYVFAPYSRPLATPAKPEERLLKLAIAKNDPELINRLTSSTIQKPETSNLQQQAIETGQISPVNPLPRRNYQRPRYLKRNY